MQKSRVLNILVVDNEEEICNMFRKWFSLENHQAKSTLSGKKALSLVKKSKFDVVFISVILAELPGLEVLEKIKKISPETQVIMMTGKLIERDLMEEIKQKGASGFLQKPFSMEDVQKCLANLFT